MLWPARTRKRPRRHSIRDELFMGSQFFYAVDGRQNGPVSFDELKQLASRDELKRWHKVWCKGMQNWQAAGSLEGLFDDLPPDLDEEAAPKGTPSCSASAAAGQKFGSTPQPSECSRQSRKNSDTPRPALPPPQAEEAATKDAVHNSGQKDISQPAESGPKEQPQPPEQDSSSRYSDFQWFAAVMLTLAVVIVCVIIAVSCGKSW
jgi:hypothetical protein